MKLAHIENGLVKEIFPAESENVFGHLPNAADYIKIPEEIENIVQLGWSYDGEFHSTQESRNELKKKIKKQYESYLSQFFTDKELIHMQLSLAAQKGKAIEVYAWIEQGIELAMNYQTQIDLDQAPEVDYSTLGAPPHTYEGVITE